MGKVDISKDNTGVITGVISKDARLEDVGEILRFLQTYNTRPRLFCRVHGYHYGYSDDAGNYEERLTPAQHDENPTPTTDFDYLVDLTQFVFPYGYMQCRDNPPSLSSIPILAFLEQHLAD